MTDPNRAAIEAIYQRHLTKIKRAITAHLPRLRGLAAHCERIVEFGVKSGASSSALLACPLVISYDLVPTHEARELQQAAGSRWDYRLQDTRTAPIEPCDLLFVDSLHTYDQVHAELTRHADAVRRWLVFHDHLTFGSIGANGETGKHLWTYQPGQSVPMNALGIRPAIDNLMIRDRSWAVRSSYTDSHGLLVLERQ